MVWRCSITERGRAACLWTLYVRPVCWVRFSHVSHTGKRRQRVFTLLCMIEGQGSVASRSLAACHYRSLAPPPA